MKYLIVKFGRRCGLVFEQKVEISHEGILELGNLIILPKMISLPLAIRDLIFLMLLKFFRTETLVIFSSMTSDNLICSILCRLLM